MIQIILSITETEGNIKVEASGGDVIKATGKETRFTRKYLSYINKFNTDYKKIHSPVKMRIRKIRK
jgi:hypothetical protein